MEPGEAFQVKVQPFRVNPLTGSGNVGGDVTITDTLGIEESSEEEREMVALPTEFPLTETVLLPLPVMLTEEESTLALLLEKLIFTLTVLPLVLPETGTVTFFDFPFSTLSFVGEDET